MLDPKQSIFVPESSNVHQAAREQKLIWEIGNYLAQAYPGHWWHVECKWQHRFVQIRLPHLEVIFPQMRQVGKGFSFAKLHNPSDYRRQAVNAGGLLLEAYNLERGKLEKGSYQEQANPLSGGAMEYSRFHKTMRKHDIPMIKITSDPGVHPMQEGAELNLELVPG